MLTILAEHPYGDGQSSMKTQCYMDVCTTEYSNAKNTCQTSDKPQAINLSIDKFDGVNYNSYQDVRMNYTICIIFYAMPKEGE